MAAFMALRDAIAAGSGGSDRTAADGPASLVCPALGCRAIHRSRTAAVRIRAARGMIDDTIGPGGATDASVLLAPHSLTMAAQTA